MTDLGPLSSQLGERTEQANRAAAARCLEHPALLAEVAAGLARKESSLVADCAEVLTMVALERPDLVAPYAPDLAPLLSHKAARVRWEAMHALALVADRAPNLIATLLPDLGELVRSDRSVIVRDYAVEAIGNYASSGEQAVVASVPYLQEALHLWEGKQAARALDGLAKAVRVAPALAPALLPLAKGFVSHGKPSVQKGARKLRRAIEAQLP